MDKGKAFELLVSKSLVKNNFGFLRLYDGRSVGRPMAVSQPADFIIFAPMPGFVETKDLSKDRIGIGDFRPAQIKGFFMAQKHKVGYAVIARLNGEKYDFPMYRLLEAASRNKSLTVDKMIPLKGDYFSKVLIDALK